MDLCNDIRRLAPSDRTGRDKRELNNQFDLDHRAKLIVPSGAPDFSRLLEALHIYTPRQLAVVRLLHAGRSRKAICQELGVSSSRVSQLTKAAANRFEHYEARMRVLIACELKRLPDSTLEGEDSRALSGPEGS